MLVIHFLLISSSFFILLLFININSTIKEFKINEYLKLKLENGRTVIYVNNRRFQQCMYLLLNIPVDRIEDYDEINSIDEAAAKLDRSMERSHRIVSPQTEFWGHCSNIQAWADNEYDTRILHRNLAFPLLKALADVGDPMAKKKFKEEIAMRYATGHPTVIRFLTQNGYLYYLSEDEFESMLLDIDFPSIDEYIRRVTPLLNNLQDSNSIGEIKKITTGFSRKFHFKYKYLILLKGVEKIPDPLRQDFVEIIYSKYKDNRSFPLLKFMNKAYNNFENLDVKLIVYHEKLIGIILNAKINIKNKMIENIEEIKGIEENAEIIEEIDLSNNRISKIDGLKKLKNLKRLYLKNNYIEKIEGLEDLENLELLDLSGNVNIQEIPDSLNNLHHLKMVKLTGCRITEFSELVSNFFWMGQNFRYYTKHSIDDIKYYEKTHVSKASVNGRLYKKFVRWLFKLKAFMREYDFKHNDIEKYEKKTIMKAIRSGRPTNSFLKYLYDRKQMKITFFIEMYS